MPSVSDAPVFGLPARNQKPRTRGITSMIDFGPDTFGWTGGEHGIHDLLAVAADYIDYAKIYAMNALLMPESVLKRAAVLYRDAGVKTFAGGILFEYAWQRGQLDGMISHLKKLGIPGIELSENYVELTEDERHRAIDRLQQGGLQVVYEFGRKNPEEPLSIDYLTEIVRAVGEHGIDHVTLEQSELDLLAADKPDALLSLARQPWFDRVVIEADPYRFPDQHVALLREFGNDVNLANVAPGQILRLEGFRQGIGRAVNYWAVSGDASRPAGIHHS
ncbi:MAG: Phosphosulfolactate synthase [Betaproteobacteria bacterium]|jgi:phosphosulfolactate synthase|nr:Phosphosulfolactate synthase [Betaproteobacteria bacterium]